MMVGKLELLGGNRFLCTYSNPVWSQGEISFTVFNREVRFVTIKVVGMGNDNMPYTFTKK